MEKVIYCSRWVTEISLGHTETRSRLFGSYKDIPGVPRNPNFSSWDSHRYPWAHTETRTVLFGVHIDIPGRTKQPDLFSLGFTQISLGAHSNPISYLWDSNRYPWVHTATRSLFSGIHTDIPGRTQQPDLFSLGFTQISLGAHSNPISFLWDSHRYPWAHTATRSLFFGIHTDIPGRTQQPDLFSLGFTQISLGAHSNPISFLWDSHRYPWVHTATRSLFSGIHTDIPGRTQQPDLFSLGFTQISLGAHSNPISFLWDSHRYPWAHTATRSLFFGIHTDIPGRTQQPDLFSLGFTQISLGAHSNPISFLWDSHRYPWAHTATRSLFFGIHTDIPGRTQQPDLFSLGFTQISLGAHSNPSSSLWDSHRYPWAHTATRALLWNSHRYPSLRNPSIKSHINPK